MEKIGVGNAQLHIAPNAGHTAQNDSWTMQNDGHTTRNGRNTHNVYQGPKGGLQEPPRAQGTPPTPILEKTLVSRKPEVKIRGPDQGLGLIPESKKTCCGINP